MKEHHPFSPPVIISGLIITILGGVVVALIIGEGSRFTTVPATAQTIQEAPAASPTQVVQQVVVVTATPLPALTALTEPPPPTRPNPTSTTVSAGEVRVIDGAPMIFIPAGEFMMGSTDQEIDAILQACTECNREWFDREKPQRKVYLDAFWIDKYEVTNAQYKECVDVGKCFAPTANRSPTRDSYYGNPSYDNYPVIYVSWSDASTFCERIGKRLPTEAEWEKSARGANNLIYPWGNTFDASKFNSRVSGPGDTTAVGSYVTGASPYGVMDLAGNVWEWTADWYDPNYYSISPPRNPKGPAIGQFRVMRGGAWNNFLGIMYWTLAKNRQVEHGMPPE